MTYYSSVPAAIAAITAAFRTSTALGLAGVPVRDGPEVTAAPGLEAVAVGYTGNADENVVTGTAAAEGLAVLPDRERYAVMCAIEVLDGEHDVAAARTRAYELHAACGAAIAADHTLGKTVLRASPGFGSLRQQQTGDGALARVVFPVNVDAYTGRLAGTQRLLDKRGYLAWKFGPDLINDVADLGAHRFRYGGGNHRLNCG